MIKLRTLSNPALAQHFADYMATKNITIDVDILDADAVALWLNDEQYYAEALSELEHFLNDPLAARYWVPQRAKTSSWSSGQLIAVMKQHAGPVTIIVVVLCIAVYLMQFALGDAGVLEWLVYPAYSEQYLTEFWRWITPVFLHFSLQHIVLNLLVWWFVAGAIERTCGSFKLLQIFFLSGLATCYAQSLFSGIYFGGLSGVVYAVIGYAWLVGELRPQLGLKISRLLVGMVVVWFFIDAFDLFGSRVGNAAHITGLIFGLLLAVWDVRFRYNRR